jgi:hypothetical protein
VIRLYAELAAVVVLLGAFWWYSAHERAIGEAKIVAADAQAITKARAQVAAQTQALQTQADVQAKDANDARNNLDAYMASHPTGAVLVRHQSCGSGPGMPQVAATHTADGFTSAGPAAVPEVPGGSLGTSTDISAELNTLMRAAGQLAILDRQWQQQPRPVN